MAAIMTNDSVLDAPKYSQQNPSKSKTTLQLLWTGNQKSSKIAFFVNFDLFFGISLILLLNFTDFFAATNISTYFKFLPIDIFMKTSFPTIYKAANFGHKIRLNDSNFGWL